MAEPIGATVRAGEEIIEMHQNKECLDLEKTATIVSSHSEGRGSADDSTVNPDPLAHLPEHFRKEIEEQSNVKSRKVSFKVRHRVCFRTTHYQELYRFAGTQEKFLMFAGTIFALGSGAAFPLMTIIFGSVSLLVSIF